MSRQKRAGARLFTVSVTVVAAVLALGACESGGDAESPKRGAAPGPSVVAPGRPGEPARTLSAEDAAAERADDSPNAADFTYAQMMIEHHTQALTMTELARKQAGSEKVKRLADRIAAAQKPEIGAMRGWLDSHGGAKKQDGHQHGAMPGMATEKQLGDLRGARGKAFDALFLKLMITHHDGAVTMATEALTDGNNIAVEEMATDVIAQQTAEIGRMRSMTP
ncbi:DUF305 domain-containing protein [Streptomyces sp. A3M-1-3]|nr:DUF305 domain-containing protein [Streptomyces sp. A3M-1-3]MCP3818732.1 DUF305 domain-containing protein [Streptomyces sp. A3M-1-3]